MAITASTVMELRAATGAGMMDCKKALEESGGDLDAAKDLLRKKGISIAQKKADRATNEGGVMLAISEDGKQGAIVQLACETDFVARNEQFQELIAQLAAQVLAKGADDVAGQARVDGSGTVGDLITESIGKMGENLQIIDAKKLAVPGEGAVGGYIHSNQKVGSLVSVSSDKGVDSAKLQDLAKDISMHVAASQVNAISEADLDQADIEKEKEIFKAQAAESGKPADIVEKMVQGRISKFIKEVTLLDQPFVKNPDQTIRQLVDETGKALGAELKVESFIKLQF